MTKPAKKTPTKTVARRSAKKTPAKPVELPIKKPGLISNALMNHPPYVESLVAWRRLHGLIQALPVSSETKQEIVNAVLDIFDSGANAGTLAERLRAQEIPSEGKSNAMATRYGFVAELIEGKSEYQQTLAHNIKAKFDEKCADAEIATVSVKRIAKFIGDIRKGRLPE